MQGMGELEGAAVLHQACLSGEQLSRKDLDYSKNALGLLEIITPIRRMASIVDEKDYALHAMDLNGDKVDEILILDSTSRVSVFRYMDGTLKKTRSIHVPFQSWSTGKRIPQMQLLLADLDLDGAKELVAYCGTKDGDGFPQSELSIFRYHQGAFKRMASTTFERSDTGGFWIGNLYGDPMPEILLGVGAYRREIRCYEFDGEELTLGWGGHLGSDPKQPIITDLDGLPGNEVLLPLWQWSHFYVNEYKVGFSGVRVVHTLPFSALVRLLSYKATGRGQGRLIFTSFIFETEREVLENIQTPERRMIGPGLFSIKRTEEGWEKPVSLLKEENFQPTTNVSQNLGLPGDTKFLLSGRRSGRDVVSAGPLPDGKCLDILPIPKGIRCAKAQLDEDPDPEFVLSGSDSVYVLGAGKPPAWTRTLLPMETMTFGTGIAVAAKMIEMGLYGEADRLYEKIARENDEAEVKGAALIGRADALICLGRISDAIGVYSKAVQIPSTQGHAFLGAARCLWDMQDWIALKEQLSQGLERYSLSSSEEEEALNLLRIVEPLAETPCQVELGSPDWPLYAPDPLSVRFQDGEFLFSATGDMPLIFGMPFRWSGESFHLSSGVRVERLDWGSNFKVCIQYPIPGKHWAHHEGMSVHFNSGGSTTFPQFNVGIYLDRRSLSRTIQNFPPSFPTQTGFHLTYTRENRGFWFRLQDEDEAEFRRFDYSKRPGTYLLCIQAGADNYAKFRCRARMNRLLLTGPNALAEGFQDEPEHVEDRLALAGGHLIMGRLAEAQKRYSEILDMAEILPDSKPKYFPRNPWDPGWRTRALLFRGMARFRNGRHPEALEDIAKAFSIEPVHCLHLFYKSYIILPRGERILLGQAIRKCAQDPQNKFWVDFLSDLKAWPGKNDHIQENLETISKTWEKVRSAEDPTAFFVNLTGFLAFFFDERFVAALFAGTPEGDAFLQACIEKITSLRRGGEYYIREEYWELLKEIPDDPLLISNFALFLLRTKLKKLRNPKKALVLAERGEECARKGVNRGLLAWSLYSLAAAHFANGDAGKACEKQREAIRELPDGKERLRHEFEERLKEYEKAEGSRGN
jgi:tetratricopeptide (TPR) repeat protein